MIQTPNRSIQLCLFINLIFCHFVSSVISLVCLEIKSALKDFTMDKDRYNKYTGVARGAVITDLKGKILRQQRLYTKAITTQESSLKGSYAVSLELARAKKPLSDGETVKRCVVAMAKAFGDANRVKNFETVFLTHCTMMRRIFDYPNHVQRKLNKSKWLQLLLLRVWRGYWCDGC